MVQTICVALAGALVFERLRVPAGALVGAMVAVSSLNLVVRTGAQTPSLLRFLALAIIGWGVAEGVTRQNIDQSRETLLPLLLAVIALFVFGGLVAVAVTRLGWTDGITAFLATSPGGLTQMSALAASLGANATVVVAAHTARVMLVMALGPVIARMVSNS